MKILVTGGAGFIGSHACKALAAAGYEPVVLDSLRTGHRWAARFGPFVHGDILETERVAALLRDQRIGAVMHFAALAYVGESISHPDLYYRTNVTGSLSLLNAMRLAGVSRFIFSSTCATFGNVDRRISEQESQNPINPYGASKLMVERILQDYAAAYGIGSVALRYFNAAGSDPDGELGEVHDPETHLLPIAMQVAAGERAQLEVFGTDYPTPDGTCIRDYIHVDDLAAAHLRALDHLAGGGGTEAVNVGTGVGSSVLEVIAATERISGCSVPYDIVARRPGDPVSTYADPKRAREVLKWQATQGLDEIIASAWAWHSTHL